MTDTTSQKQSAHSPTVDKRFENIKYWISSELNISNYQLEPASADASFRRYFRLVSDAGSWVIMDAPPEKENCQPFMKVAKLIEAVGVQAPHIYNVNEKQGFMQLSDLGTVAYLDKLKWQNADPLYTDAIRAIVKMQSIQADLPEYNSDLLHSEMNLFKDWYLNKHLNLELDDFQNATIDNTFNLLVESALLQPSVFVHRDYHSRNLMVATHNNPGVIDFQDAVNGPASYDLVSLIKDCYISWPRDKQLQWIDQYLELSAFNLDRNEFVRQLDLMGMQRHLKAIGIFARLNIRDRKPAYLNDIPRTLAYVFDVSNRYKELSSFAALLSSLGLQVDPVLLDKIQ